MVAVPQLPQPLPPPPTATQSVNVFFIVAECLPVQPHTYKTHQADQAAYRKTTRQIRCMLTLPTIMPKSFSHLAVSDFPSPTALCCTTPSS